MSGARITGIRTPVRGSRRRMILLDDESRLVVPVEVLRDLDVREGDVIEPDSLRRSIEDSAASRARERALRLLAFRDRSSAETISRLTEDGYAPAVADSVVSDLVGAGLIDDVRFAHDCARTLIGVRGLGRGRALRELSARGIPDELAHAALEELAPEGAEEERARRSAAALVRSGDTADRLAARLARRGFSRSVSLRAAREQVSVEKRGDASDESS